MEICSGIASRCWTMNHRGNQWRGADSRDRDIASAFLLGDGRMGRALRRANLPACCGSPMGDAQKSADSVLGRKRCLSLWDGLTLINCGGHFEGGTVLHLRRRRKWQRALLTGDIIQVVQDRRYVSFMRSYPNLIPLGPLPSTTSLKNRTVSVRSNLRRVVESERSLKRQSGGRKLRGNVISCDQCVKIATVHGHRKLCRQPCRLL